MTIKFMPKGSSLTIRHLTKRFGGVVAVDDLSLDIKPGETIGIIGPNGSGKSTLLALLSGLLRPDEGEIVIDGNRLQDKKAHEFARHGVRRTFQDARLIPQAPVHEHLELVAPFRPWPSLGSALFRPRTLQRIRQKFQTKAKEKLLNILN